MSVLKVAAYQHFQLLHFCIKSVSVYSEIDQAQTFVFYTVLSSAYSSHIDIHLYFYQIFQSPFRNLSFSITGDTVALDVFDINPQGLVVLKPNVDLATRPEINYNVSSSTGLDYHDVVIVMCLLCNFELIMITVFTCDNFVKNIIWSCLIICSCLMD